MEDVLKALQPIQVLAVAGLVAQAVGLLAAVVATVWPAKITVLGIANSSSDKQSPPSSPAQLDLPRAA